MKRWTFPIVLFAVLGLASEGLQAAPVTVTFTFTRVVELHCDEEFGEACANDYYPKLEIDAQGLDDGKSRFCCAHGTDFAPNWVFTRTVDSSHTKFPIHVELWDQDDLSADDRLDIANGPSSLDLTVSLKTCKWEGGGLSGQVGTEAQSQGSGSDSARIYFKIDTPWCNDPDGDGLYDGWEVTGYDANEDGIVDVNLAAMGANPQRKDLFLEIDYLNDAAHTHAPLQAAIQLVVQSFANAPVGNPDGTTGIQLHIDLGSLYGAGNVISILGPGGVTGTFGDYGGGGNATAEGNGTGVGIVDWDGIGGNPGVNFFTIKNLNTNRNDIFRYGLFVHQTNARAANNDCTSGWAKGTPGVNFLVSLGGTNAAGAACWGVNAAGRSVGTVLQQAGTLMHEFGHALGLRHGGDDDVNTKPNYLSVMNYAMQPCTVLAAAAASVPGGCDYSRIKLGTLNETSLDECRGIDQGVLGLGAVNFDGVGGLSGTTCVPSSANTIANLNGDFVDGDNDGTQDPGEATIFSNLTGFRDWGALVYNFRNIANFTTAGAPTTQEPNPEDIARARAVLSNLLEPKLKVAQTAPAGAVPGQTLSYNVKVENTTANQSKATALQVVLTDTLPDSSTQTFTIGTMMLGTTTDRTLAYTVPCAAADGTVVRNTAMAQGLDLLGNIVSDMVTVGTSIHAPVLTLSLTGTSTVNAGEAILYTIRYANTGSGAATNVVLTATIPASIYYSLALDQGAGPHPATVTFNGDGTRTLAWTIGTVMPASGERTIEFTARPALLSLGGTALRSSVALSYQNAPGCVAPPLNATTGTNISERLKHDPDPDGPLHWRKQVEDVREEILARIQATDQRFDGRAGTAPDGALTKQEVSAAFADANLWTTLFDRDTPTRLEEELLALYFNLATRQLNAATIIHDHDLPRRMNARDAALKGAATLAMPFGPSTEKLYHRACEIIDEFND